MNANTILDTSCTKDQAVAIMLGWSDEPIRYRPVSDYPTQEEWGNTPVYSLHEDIEDRKDTLKDEYAEALSNGMPVRDIEKKKSAVNIFEKQIVLARTYLCAIDDELVKGNASALRINPSVSNTAYVYITLTSLKTWAQQTFNLNILLSILTLESVQANNLLPKLKSAPGVKMREQEDVILEAIVRLGSDPLALPMKPRNGSGIKAQVRSSLENHPLFNGTTIFDTAWERLRYHKRIVDKK